MKYEPRPIMLPRMFLRRCRESMFKLKVADSTSMEMTGGSLLMRTLIFRRILLRNVFAADEKFVGLLIPPSAGGILANAATTLAGRIAVNLNYTVSSDTLNYCIAQCGIRHVLTSRKFMERFDFKLNAELVFLEDLRKQVTLADKIVAATDTYLVPPFILERWLGLHNLRGDDLFTIIYTSGSTGRPKGVMLTYDNIGTNVTAIEDTLNLDDHDSLCGILPLFHSMGFTVGLWAILGTKVRGIYHFSPLDAKIIGKLCRDYAITIMVSTPTFLRSYLRRCEPEDFAKMELVVTGAEKLPGEVLAAFEEKFHIRPMEGYGTTELSPIVSFNIPINRTRDGDDTLQEIGTIGKPIPGVSAKVIDHETGEDLGLNEAGILCIKGPNVMKGYYKMPEKTAEVIRDGWYVTGDMATIEADGFIRITGRLSRFSKIGGEMVPHIHIEDILQSLVTDDEEKLAVAVTAVPDPKKGERLIVFHLPTDKTPDELVKELASRGLPNLWIPSTDSFFEVEHIPLLGTGKLDLQAVKELANEKVGAGSVSG